MALTLFSRPAPPAAEPEPWPEIGETWTPEGVTVVERYANQVGAVVLVFSTDDQSYHHVLACLGCHYSESTDPDKTYTSGLTLTEAGRFANTHATSCRALPRDIPARPDDVAAREQIRKWVASWRRRDRDEEIYLRSFNHGRLVLQRTNDWIETALQQLADEEPDILLTKPSEYSGRMEFYALRTAAS
ncbi:hypothetical protein [Streptomyces solaniscabiei]|uniref:hypothetical protein n=1 Tax=Streptomyces solaniscabiei TaxID=2683255 RepID=UPI001CE2AB5C|nr:hypothetical protein [Streptomyces solaniscabiei]